MFGFDKTKYLTQSRHWAPPKNIIAFVLGLPITSLNCCIQQQKLKMNIIQNGPAVINDNTAPFVKGCRKIKVVYILT